VPHSDEYCSSRIIDYLRDDYLNFGNYEGFDLKITSFTEFLNNSH